MMDRKIVSAGLVITSPIYLVLSFLSFALPFFLGGPQILVGSLVNACLFLSVLYLPYPWSLSVLFFPSLGVLSRGFIFGSLTSFLVLMLPFIWLGNFVLVFYFKKFLSFFKNYFISSLLAAVLKFAVLYISVNLLFSLSLAPKLFLTAMGKIQLATALIGSLTAFLVKVGYDSIKRA
jgi:hypothetical protein